MNTIYSISRNAPAYFSENFLSALTAQEKKVALVAAAIFAVAFLYCFARFTKAYFESTRMSMKTDLGDGRFKKVYRDGTIEIGEFKNDKLNGEGQRLFPDELIEETEELEDMKAYPKGHSDIREQKGEFKEGVLSGQGKILFWDGRVYEGTFVDGLLVEGTKDYSAVKDNPLNYEKGKFVDDKLDGTGETSVKPVAKRVIEEATDYVLKAKEKEKKKAVESDSDSDEKRPLRMCMPGPFPGMGYGSMGTDDESEEDSSLVMCKPCSLETLKIEEVTEEKVSEKKVVEKKETLEVEEKPIPQAEEAKDISEIKISEKETSEIKLFVKQYGGGEYAIEISLTDTILALKTKIQERHGIKIDAQRLIFAGKLLQDDKTIESYTLTKDSKIILAVRQPAAAAITT